MPKTIRSLGRGSASVPIICQTEHGDEKVSKNGLHLKHPVFHLRYNLTTHGTVQADTPFLTPI